MTRSGHSARLKAMADTGGMQTFIEPICFCIGEKISGRSQEPLIFHHRPKADSVLPVGVPIHKHLQRKSLGLFYVELLRPVTVDCEVFPGPYREQGPKDIGRKRG